MEANAGGILIYLSYKPRNDLTRYKSSKLESTVNGIYNTNVIIKCIYMQTQQ